MEEQNGVESSNINRATQTSPQNNHRPVSIYSVSSRRVRLNWFEYLRDAWGNISRTNKIIIGTSFIVGIIQIIITIVMLIIGRNDTCDKPLHIFLIIFVIRSGCSLPLMLYQHLRPSGYLNRNNNNNNSNSNSSNNNNRNLSTGLQNTENSNGNDHHHELSDNNASTTTTSTSPVTDHPSSSNSTMPSITQSTPLPPPTSLTNGWIDRIKSLLDLISILWFIVGNYLLFTVSDECHFTGKHLFYTILAWVLLGYFLILIPLILCATIIFCLPCLLVMMRAMNVDYATGMVGANKSEIQEIPIYKFKQSDIQQQQQQDQPNTSSNIASNTNNNNNKVTNPNSSTTSKFIWVRHIFNFPFKKKNSNTDLETNYESVTFDSVDATCTICLSNYENDELICVLPCNHHFHKDCVHEWLALNYKCPLCQRDFRGKKVEEE